jgi:hypothetical protein
VTTVLRRPPALGWFLVGLVFGPASLLVAYLALPLLGRGGAVTVAAAAVIAVQGLVVVVGAPYLARVLAGRHGVAADATGLDLAVQGWRTSLPWPAVRSLHLVRMLPDWYLLVRPAEPCGLPWLPRRLAARVQRRLGDTEPAIVLDLARLPGGADAVERLLRAAAPQVPLERRTVC